MNSKQALHLQFREDQWIRYNVKLSKKVGIYGSILLGYLINKEIYFSDNGKLVDDAYFYATRDTIEEHTALSPHQQREAIKALKECGFVATKDMCTPRKTFYAIMHDKLSNFLTTNDQKIEPLDVENFDDIYEYRNISTNISTKREKEVVKKSSFSSLTHQTTTFSKHTNAIDHQIAILTGAEDDNGALMYDIAKKFQSVPRQVLEAQLRKFVLYWTEPGRSGKMKYQMEKTFELYRRLDTWIARADKYGDIPRTGAKWSM